MPHRHFHWLPSKTFYDLHAEGSPLLLHCADTIKLSLITDKPKDLVYFRDATGPETKITTTGETAPFTYSIP